LVFSKSLPEVQLSCKVCSCRNQVFVCSWSHSFAHKDQEWRKILIWNL